MDTIIIDFILIIIATIIYMIIEEENVKQVILYLDCSFISYTIATFTTGNYSKVFMVLSAIFIIMIPIMAVVKYVEKMLPQQKQE